MKVHFEPGATTDPVTGMLLNANGDAQNVQVALLNENLQKIDLRDNSNSQVAPVTGGIATLKYYGQYEAVGAAAHAGTVDTNVSYTVTYP